LNGTALPATLVEEGSTYRVNSGSLTITGTTFNTTLDVTVLLAGLSFPLTGTCTGTLTRNGNNLSFTTTASTGGDIECEGGTASGSWDGANTVTVDAVGQKAVYKRQ
jgi:polyisoprenoid-binding protein YceI